MSDEKQEDSLQDVNFDEDETLEAVQKDFEAAIDLAQKIKHDVEAEVFDHVGKDEKDQCGYCGQCFGPDDIVVEKEIYGKEWRFCDEQCLKDFMDASNFKDENLDAETDIDFSIEKDE